MTKVLVDRRAFLGTTVGGLVGVPAWAQPAITRPVVSEKARPLEIIHPVATDEYRGLAVLRKPPGAGLHPAVIWFHGEVMRCRLFFRCALLVVALTGLPMFLDNLSLS
jgi:hypothetical protein